jgi:hypothetical protein
VSTKKTFYQRILHGLVCLGLFWCVGYAEVPDKEQIKESIQSQLKMLDQMPEEDKTPKANMIGQTGSGHTTQKTEEVKKLKAEIWSERKDSKSSLIIKFDNGLPYPALFRRGDYIYLVISFPTDISKAKWSDAVVPEITGLDIMAFDEATVVRWKMNHIYPRMQIDTKANQFVIDVSQEMSLNDGFDLDIFQPRRKGESWRSHLKNAQTDVTLDLGGDGQDVWVIFADQTNRTIPKRDYPEFTILESYHGVGINLKSEDLEYSYVRKSLSITKAGDIGNSLGQSGGASIKPKTIFDDFVVEHPEEKNRELILKVYSGNPNLEDAVDLVWNYLYQGMALEVQGVVQSIFVKNKDLALTTLWKSIVGLAALMRGQFDEAEKSLELVLNEPDATFWKSVAVCCGQKNIDPAQLAELLAGKPYLFKLPPVIRDKIWSRILEFGLLNNQKQVLEEYVLKGEKPTTRLIKPMHNFISAYLKLDPKNPSTVNALFDIWQKSPGTKVGILAAFERLKFLHQVKKIEPEQEFKQLEKLRFQWRGDQLEYTIAKYLIDRYMEEKQYAKMLPVARKTIKYFTKQAHDDGLPKLMQEALVKYFQQDHISVLEMLSIFQDYTSIAPDNEQGDMIMIKATNVLANLELYDVVVNLLKDYLTQKAKEGPDTQQRRDHMLYRMAVAFHLARKFPDALKALAEIKNPPADLIDDVAILKSEAHLQSGHEDKALSVLGNTPLQLIHKAEILLGDKKWSLAHDVYHTLLFNDYKLGDSEKARAIVNYVLCLYMDKHQNKLQEVNTKFADFMKGKPGESAFELMTVPDAKVSLTHLQSIQQVATFTDRLKGLFAGK